MHEDVRWRMRTGYDPGSYQASFSPLDENVFYIKVNDTILPAHFAEGEAAESLKDWLKKQDVVVNMSDYGGWEKVGSLGRRFNRQDRQMTAKCGDIMLYQGEQIVIFYGENSWSYSPLGKIDNVTKDNLLQALGTGDTEITLSLQK